MAKGCRRNGLYALKDQEDVANKAFIAFLTSNSAIVSNTALLASNKHFIIHLAQRLGHLNEKALNLLHDKSLIDVFSWKKLESVCTSSQMAKSCKLPFVSNQNLSMFPSEKIHWTRHLLALAKISNSMLGSLMIFLSIHGYTFEKKI